jgi:hypothetical protein
MIPKNIRRLSLILSLFFLMQSASAIEVSGLKYGSLKRSEAVTRNFESFKVQPTYRYYISRWGNIPQAIIGIDQSYNFRPGNWEAVDMTPQLLRSWVSKMDVIYGFQPYGSQILDHQGNQIGIWYSSKQWTTVVIEDDDQVAVFTPEPPGFRGKK